MNRVLTKGEQEREKERLGWIDQRRVADEKLKSSEGVAGLAHIELSKREPELWSLAAFLAGRFAAKEAAIKAHPHRHLTLHDVSIERMQSSEDGTGVIEKRLGTGPPVVRIAAQDGEEMDGCAMLSISHDGDYATAVCIGYAVER